MAKTQPIRNPEDIKKLRNFYKENEPHPRNYTLICIGLNTALRISDLLVLTWGDVYDFSKKQIYNHLLVTEEKTNKKNLIYLNKNVKDALIMYQKTLPFITKNMYLFMGTHAKNNHPLHRSQAYRIIRHACEKLELEKNISCHSMRKTFGYQAWKSGVQPALLMNIYNHSSYEITKIYLGIEQDDKDAVFNKINL